MAKSWRRMAITSDLKDLINVEVREIFLIYNPEFEKYNISLNFLIYQLVKSYLTGTKHKHKLKEMKV